jgi:hypothetical protein
MNYKEIQEKLSKNDFVFYFSHYPGFVPKLCSKELFINSDLDFELILFFHENDSNEFANIRENKTKEEVEEYVRNNRRHLYLSCKTPKPIRNKLVNILGNTFKLKESYIENSGNEYQPDGVSHESATLNHEKGVFSVNLGYGFNKELMNTKPEKDFMNLIKLVEDWLEKLSDDLIKYYTIE